MYGLANCSLTVRRGTGTNQFGDTVDTGAVVSSGVPAYITVKRSSVSDAATQQPRIIETITGAVGSNVDIRDTDQLTDDTHGVTYSVQAVTRELLPGITPDQRLELRRVR